MRKRFDIEVFNSEHFRSRYFRQSPRKEEKRVLQTLLDILTILKCKTVVWESDYIDRDFLDEYSAFYSHQFKQYPPRTDRLHFLKDELPSDINRQDMASAMSAKEYLGFCVLRPTEFNRVGRTVIPPPFADADRCFCTCSAAFPANILGTELLVSGVPFIQQDSQVGACAQASLWTVARYMSRKFHTRDYLPAEITALAQARSAMGRSYPAAEKGLNSSQMLDALQGMGLSAIFYSKKNLDILPCEHLNDPFKNVEGFDKEERIKTAKLADIAYKYIESRLPVIFMTGDHAMVGVGHTYDPGAQAEAAIERIPAFLVHDDGVGPYRELPLFTPNEAGQAFQRIKSIIVVTPLSATLSGAEAEALVMNSVEFLPTLLSDMEKIRISGYEHIGEIQRFLAENEAQFEYRTYLIQASEFQRDLRTTAAKGRLDNSVASLLLDIDYPKYVWITEVSVKHLLEYPKKSDRKCLGKFVLDSTAPSKSKALMAMHFMDMVALYDRQGKEADYFQLFKGSTPVPQKLIAA